MIERKSKIRNWLVIEKLMSAISPIIFSLFSINQRSFCRLSNKASNSSPLLLSITSLIDYAGIF